MHAMNDRTARGVARYRALLADARRTLRDRLSRAEQLLICDVLNGALADPYIVGMVAMEVENALPENITAQWHVPAAPLMATLRALSPVEEVALLDAVERWYERGDRDADVLDRPE